MKVNLKKLDKETLVEFFVAHGEKIAFGVVMVVVLLLAYGFFGQKPYDKSPQDFANQTKQVTDRIATATFDKGQLERPPEAKQGEAPPEYLFIAHKPWSPPVYDRAQRRPEPTLLAVRDLHVATDYGAVSVVLGEDEVPAAAPEATAAQPPASKPPAPGRNPRGAEEGAGIFQLPGAPGGRQPQPARGGSMIEAARQRASGGAAGPSAGSRPRQASVGGPVKGKQWVVITGLIPHEAQVRAYREAFEGTYLADPGRDQPSYVGYDVERAEVPPGSAATVDPAQLEWKPVDRAAIEKLEMSFAIRAPDLVGEQFRAGPACRDLPPLAMKSHDKSVVHPKIPLLLEPEQAVASAPRPSPTPGAAGAPPRRGGGMIGAARAAAGGSAPRPNPSEGFSPPGPVRPGAEDGEPPPPPVENQLFRFFDYTVEPGKTYRYRVRVLLANANRGMPPRYLAKPDLANGATRAAPWSEPSPPIFVPRGNSVLAGPVKPARGLNEPKVTLLVRMWLPERAADAAHLPEIARGTMINFDSQVPVEDPSTGSAAEEVVKFATDTLLVDLTGGEMLNRGRAPAQVLLLRPDGRLMVKSELADGDAFESGQLRQQQLRDASNPADVEAGR